jgi:hypothetical protein
MKNSITIDLDIDRDQQVLFMKDSSFVQPSNREEAAEMVHTDIKTITAGLKILIDMAAYNGYGNVEEFVTYVNGELNELLIKETSESGETENTQE